MGSFRIARQFPEGERPRISDPEERASLPAYLEQGRIVGGQARTDGVWLWTEADLRPGPDRHRDPGGHADRGREPQPAGADHPRRDAPAHVMSQEFRAMIEGLVEEYNRQAVQIRDMYTELKELVVTSGSADGMVTVTMGNRGQIRSLTLNPRVYRKLSPSELSAAILTQIDAATAELAERTKELMTPFVPEGLSYEEVFGDGAGLDEFLPKPVDLSGEDPG